MSQIKVHPLDELNAVKCSCLEKISIPHRLFDDKTISNFIPGCEDTRPLVRSFINRNGKIYISSRELMQLEEIEICMIGTPNEEIKLFPLAAEGHQKYRYATIIILFFTVSIQLLSLLNFHLDFPCLFYILFQ